MNKHGFKWKDKEKKITSSFGLISKFVFLSLNGDAMKNIFYFLRYWNKCLELLTFGFICSLTIILFSDDVLFQHFCSYLLFPIFPATMTWIFVLLKKEGKNSPF